MSTFVTTVMIDISPAMTAKIIKLNGQVIHRSTYQDLTKEEWKHKECKAEHNLFMELLHQMLGPCTVVRELIELGAEDTLQNDPHENKLQNAMLDEEQ